MFGLHCLSLMFMHGFLDCIVVCVPGPPDPPSSPLVRQDLEDWKQWWAIMHVPASLVLQPGVVKEIVDAKDYKQVHAQMQGLVDCSALCEAPLRRPHPVRRGDEGHGHREGRARRVLRRPDL